MFRFLFERILKETYVHLCLHYFNQENQECIEQSCGCAVLKAVWTLLPSTAAHRWCQHLVGIRLGSRTTTPAPLLFALETATWSRAQWPLPCCLLREDRCIPRPEMVLLLILVVLVPLVGELGVNWSSRSSLWTQRHGWLGWALKLFSGMHWTKLWVCSAQGRMETASLYVRTPLVSTFSGH